MPYVNVKAVRGVMTERERERLIERITDVVVEVFAQGNEEFRPNVWVVVEEVEPGQWGSGGKTVDVAAVRRVTGRE
ncbi:MAG TPA: tautomerase family protein [Chloroflexota bacterium]|nr:tautomerase family protein [Chloroflexota bacterium]